MKKRLIGIALAVALLMLVTTTALGAANSLTVSGNRFCVGDTFTVKYAIPNDVAQVGSISLEITYDSKVFTVPSIKTYSLSGEAAVAPDSSNNGRIGATWVSTYNAISIQGGTTILEATFEVIGESAQGSAITPSVEIYGGEDGMTDLTAASGATNTSQSVIADPAPIVVSGVTLNKSTMTLTKKGATETLVATIAPANATNQSVTWSSSNVGAVTVSQSGVVTAQGNGTATITVKTEDGGYTAYCTVTVHDHALDIQRVTAVPATCTATGSKEYWECSCGKWFEDKDATKEITDKSSIVTEKIAHSYGEKVESKYLKSAADCENAAVYYKSCTVCGEKGNETFASGKALGHIGGIATCQNKAICSRCGKEYGDLDPKKHDGETKVENATAATCTEKGQTGDVYCLGCGELVEESLTIDPLGHVGGEANCQKKAICERCGQEYGELGPHKFGEWEVVKAATETEEGTKRRECLFDGYEETGIIPVLGHTHVAESDKWESDGTYHWLVCACGEHLDEAEHIFGEWDVIREATEDEDGLKAHICEVCEYRETQEIVFAADDQTDKDNSTADSDQVKTGDTTNILVWCVTMVISLAALMIILGKKMSVSGKHVR